MIKIYSIEKIKKDNFYEVNQNYKKMISSFSSIEEVNIMNKTIVKAHSIGEKKSKTSYSEAFSPYIKNFSVALDVEGKKIDTFKFSELFNSNINFFIGGAYGFEKSFLTSCDAVISLSSLTFSHKLAKTILYEQIYRALCIKNNHPYHKN